MLLFLYLMLLVALALLARRLPFRARPRVGRRRAPQGATLQGHRFPPPKPAWVRCELLRLKAWHPDLGCRKLAHTFNHLHHRRGETVGKTFVAGVLRGRGEELRLLRKKLERRKPRPVPKNLLWALDLTFLPDPHAPRAVLGLLDHGTRACLALRELRTRSAVSLLRCLLDAVERYGTPKILRTDNDPVFTARLVALSLWLLGIRHQRTAPFCPWQNGRIERFFGTLKDRLLGWLDETGVPDDLASDLAIFRAWYNHARPHQSLGGRAPAMAWTGARTPLASRPRYVSAWDGRLTGYLFQT